MAYTKAYTRQGAEFIEEVREWVDGTGEPGGPGTKSAKGWADEAALGRLAPVIELSVTGTANAITASMPSGMTAYANGQMFRFFPTADNTGAVTLQIGGLAVNQIVAKGGSALQAGDLKAGQPYTIRVSATSGNFRLINDLPREVLASAALTGTPTAPTAAVGTNTTQVATAAMVQNEKVRPYAVLAPSGTDTLTVAAPSGYTAYSSNQYFRVIIANTNTGAVTLSIGGLGALPVLTSQGVALTAGKLTGGFYVFRCSGTDFRIMERLPAEILASPAMTGTPTAPTAAVGTNTTQVATTALVQGEKSRPFATLAPSGTDTLTVAAPTGVSAYTSNQYFKVLIVNRNTGPVTLNIGGLGALPVQTGAGVALAAGQLPPGWWEMRCSGTAFRIMEKLPHEIEADLLRSPRLIGQHTLPIDVSNPNTPPLTGSFAGLPVHGFTATGMCKAHNGLWAIANCGVATEAQITANNPADFAPSIVFVTPDFRTKVYEILLRPILPNSKIIQGIALDTTNNSYWVADIQGQRFRNISYAGTLLGSIELATVAGWDTAGTVNALAYDPTQHGLWCNPQLTDDIYLIDIATQTIVTTFTGQPTDIDHFYYDDATKYLWWTRGNNGSTGLVTIFNTVTGTVVSNNWVPASLAIEGLYYDSTLDRLYTVNDAALHVTAGTPPVGYVAEYEFAA